MIALWLSSCNQVKHSGASSAFLDKPATAYVMRNGQKIEIPMTTDNWIDSTLIQDGDTINISEGVISKRIDMNASPKKIQLKGAGIDKTFFSGDVDVTKGCGVILTNMTVSSTDFRSWDESAYIHIYHSKLTKRPKPKYFYSKIDPEDKYRILRVVPPLVIVFSEIEFEVQGYLPQVYFSATRDKNGKLTPVFSENYGAYIKLQKVSKEWAKSFDATDLFALNNIRAFERLKPKIEWKFNYSMFKKTFVHFKPQLDLLTLDNFHLPQSDSYKPSPIALQWYAKADQFKAQNLFLLEYLALLEANQTNEGFPFPEITQRFEMTKNQLSTLYGCHLKRSNAKNADLKSVANREPRRRPAFEEVIKSIKTLSPSLYLWGSKSSSCQIDLITLADYFRMINSGSSVVLSETQLYKESEASKKRRQMLEMERAADNRAREQAAQRAFNSRLNNLTSTAKQLHENRNSIETRADGTYLVVNNKALKQNTVKVAEAKGLPPLKSSDIKWQKNGKKITYRFYQIQRDAVQYDMLVSYQQIPTLFHLPVRYVQKKVGPCVAEKITNGWSANFGDSMVSGKCGNGFSDRTLRPKYAQEEMVPILKTYIEKQVIPTMLKETQIRTATKTDAAKLEREIAKTLLGKSSKKIGPLSEKVLGKSYSLAEVTKLLKL